MTPRLITIVPHTHWDREWYEPFEVFRARLVDTLDAALDELEEDPRLHFTLDGQVSMIDDYLEIRAENEERLRALVRAGRLHIGPWYTQADSLLVDGEALLRNLSLGVRRAEQLGGATLIGYMADQFGHAAQVPQLLGLLGIRAAVLWRGVGPERPPHAFTWQGPDDSSVTTLWLPDGYGSGRFIPSDPAGFAAAIEKIAARRDDASLLIPVGDDHVRLATWVTAARAELVVKHPEMRVEIGGYGHHLPKVGGALKTIRGELRSPAFAPVLASVASTRMREKQAAYRATQLLLHYAEPLASWVARAGGRSPTHLIDRAWRYLIQNHAHDSAAGAGVDATHKDVRARYRWAEQLAIVARDHALKQLGATSPTEHRAFVPTATSGSFLIEVELPKSLSGAVVARGPDGVGRPLQFLSEHEEAPLFEGEFSAADLAMSLGSLDPATPLFGRYLTGLTATDEGNGHVRLDVGMGETMAPAARLAEDQRSLTALIEKTERFKVVLHGDKPTRPALVQVGPGAEASFVTYAVEEGAPAASFTPAQRVAGADAITNGIVTVRAFSDGSVSIDDGKRVVSAGNLVDEGDRGDLYHFEPVAPAVYGAPARVEVIESGPLRARLRVEQEIPIPRALAPDRHSRDAQTAPMKVTTEVTLVAGQRRVDFQTTLVNEHEDHRLRATVRLPFYARRFDVEHGLHVVARPFEPTKALGGGVERAAPTGQHHLFVDVGAEGHGVALMSRGLPEHEVSRDGETTEVALTLLRSVGWLSRGDLAVIDHAAGPMLPTPEAQELGPHTLEYAVLLHDGDWREGDVLAEARRYAAPAQAVRLTGSHPVPSNVPLVDVSPSSLVLTALQPAPDHGLIARVLNTSAKASTAVVRLPDGFREAQVVDPLGRPSAEPKAEVRGGEVVMTLRPWQLASVMFR